MRAAPIVRAVKRIIANERSNPVDEAIGRHAAARTECDNVENTQGEAVRVAREAFEREGTAEAADELARISNRAELLVARARQKMNDAWKEREKAEAAATAKRLVDLDAKTSRVDLRVAALADEAFQHLAALVEITKKRDAIVAEALQAHEEARRLRGADHEQGYRGRMAIESARSALRIRIRESMMADDRVRVERLFEGGWAT